MSRGGGGPAGGLATLRKLLGMSYGSVGPSQISSPSRPGRPTSTLKLSITGVHEPPERGGVTTATQRNLSRRPSQAVRPIAFGAVARTKRHPWREYSPSNGGCLPKPWVALRRHSIGRAPQLECTLIGPRGDQVAMGVHHHPDHVLIMRLHLVLQLTLGELERVQLRVLPHAMHPAAPRRRGRPQRSTPTCPQTLQRRGGGRVAGAWWARGERVAGAWRARGRRLTGRAW